jgi:hypothetical protein
MSRLKEPKEENLDKDLICMVCLDVVYDPLECSTC